MNEKKSMQLGMIGLGRMGSNMVRRLLKAGHECVVFDRSADAVKGLAKEKAVGAASLKEFVQKLNKPRAIWLMVPAAVVDSSISELCPLLESGDILIDGGNSYYIDDIRRAKELSAIGRSPDHVAGLVTGLAMRPQILDDLRLGAGATLLRYYEYARHNDLYLCFAVVPPSGIRSEDLFPGQQRDDPRLQVVGEDDAGLVISGMKMLATSGAYADEVWIGNLTPIDDKHKAEKHHLRGAPKCPRCLAVGTSAICRAWRRAADYPLSTRFDEGDCVLVCERVHVPWERIFLHDNGAWSRRIYIETPANCYQNHQSNVRFWAKMQLVAGLREPPLRGKRHRPAAARARGAGPPCRARGDNRRPRRWPDRGLGGVAADLYATPNRRMMYATLNWCQENHSRIVDALRTLVGGLPMQMPASADVLDEPDLKDRFQRWWRTPTIDAELWRMTLYKLAWDLVGSEFAGRHQLYEKFYAGSSIVVRNQNDREAPWQKFHAVVDDLIDGIHDDA